MVVADASVHAAMLSQTRARMVRAMRAHLTEDRTVVDQLTRRLGDPRRLVSERQQRLDDLWLRVRAASSVALGRRRGVVDRLERRLVARHPQTVLARHQGVLNSLRLRLGSSMRAGIERSAGDLRDQASRLRSLSPLAVLARGYSIALDADGRTITDAAGAERGQSVEIRLHRGRLLTQVLETVTQEDGDAGSPRS
jgi:exodeoxyribonuclease VII large subunit